MNQSHHVANEARFPKQALVRRWFLACLFPLVAVASCKRPATTAAAAPSNPMDRVQPVEVMPIERRTLEESVDLVGSLAANESAELRSELSGNLVEILFEEGSTLRKGAPLAKLDTREFEAQLAEARAKFTLAERTMERLKKLLESDAASRLEFDQAEADFGQLQASIRLLETRIDKSTIRAPFDGITGSRSVSVGDYVSPQTVITTLDDLSRLKVELEVPERYLSLTRKGAGFAVHTTSGGADTRGEVYFVSSAIEPKTRSAKVKGYVINPPELLRPGMFANVKLILRVHENVLVVPETAVLNSPRGQAVVVARDKDGLTVADFVPVTVGVRIPGYVEVTPVGPPLAEGDRIVSAGVGGLILLPGMKLQPVAPVVKPGPPPTTDRTLPKPPAGK